MSSAPLYAHRLAQAVEALSALEIDWIDRRTLGEILAVSKWTAWRLLKACGASEGPGGALAIRRAKLIRQLETLREGCRVAAETARRSRLETYLEGLARFARGRHSEIARNERASNWSGRSSLPRPGRRTDVCEPAHRFFRDRGFPREVRGRRLRPPQRLRTHHRLHRDGIDRFAINTVRLLLISGR